MDTVLRNSKSVGRFARTSGLYDENAQGTLRMKLAPAPNRALVAACILEVLALSPPGMSFLDQHLPHWAQSSPIVTYLIGIPYTVLSFAMFGLATYFCLPLGIAICAVLLSKDIPVITKVVVTVMGCGAYISLLRWASTTKLF
jgi:hypothetical protein